MYSAECRQVELIVLGRIEGRVEAESKCYLSFSIISVSIRHQATWREINSGNATFSMASCLVPTNPIISSGYQVPIGGMLPDG
eukprot:1354086-Rhodomonas_salina.1